MIIAEERLTGRRLMESWAVDDVGVSMVDLGVDLGLESLALESLALESLALESLALEKLCVESLCRESLCLERLCLEILRLERLRVESWAAVGSEAVWRRAVLVQLHLAVGRELLAVDTITARLRWIEGCALLLHLLVYIGDVLWWDVLLLLIAIALERHD